MFRIVLYVIVAFLGYVTFSFYRTLRLKFSKLTSYIGAFIWALSSQVFSLNRYLERVHSIDIPLWLENLGYGILLFMIFLGFFYLIIDILKLIRLYPKKFLKYQFYVDIAIMFASIVVLSYGAHNATVTGYTTYNLASSKINRDLKIIVMSDFHIGGPGITRERLAQVVEEINEMNPDLIFLAGDILDNTYRPFEKQKYSEIFAKLKPKIGTFAVLGNHEYYGEGEDKAIEVMSNGSGIKFLRDEVLRLPKVNVALIGRDDGGHRKQNPRIAPLEKLLAQTEANDFKLVIIHRPAQRGDNLDKFTGGADLVVSGHTHHGQFFPISLITRRMYYNSWGLLKHKNTDMITTAGFGLWGPAVRLGSYPEVAVVNIKKE